MSAYSPSTHILREASRIVRMTTVPAGTGEVRTVEFYRNAALAMAYAKSDAEFASIALTGLRYWARNITETKVTPKVASAARAYSTLHTRG